MRARNKAYSFLVFIVFTGYVLATTVNIETDDADGYLYDKDATYLTAQQKTTADVNDGGGEHFVVGQQIDESNDFYVYRAGLFFDTNSIPDDQVIQSAYITLHFENQPTLSLPFYIIIQSGMPNHPNMPTMVVADYNQGLYGGNGGQLSSEDVVQGQYNNIILNATGKEWINRSGYTRFMLRSSRDINQQIPQSEEPESWQIRSAEHTSNTPPKLVVTYSEGSFRQLVNGTLANDKSQMCK